MTAEREVTRIPPVATQFFQRVSVPKVCPHCRTEYSDEQLICPNDGAMLSGAGGVDDPILGSMLAERYRVIRMLGEGGMGRVYLAEHVRMGRMSAVKVMSPALAPTADAISRFNREAANASRINHPNVAAIYDFGETADGTLYLAMEYVEGEALSALLRRAGPLSLARTADFTRQIADGLNAAHQLSIVHRDLKPDNILVARDTDGNERVKVVDFGIAKTARGGGQTVTTAGMSIGTPEYMSPEQLAGDSVDARTDIYSLGLVTFTMLTGELPHPTVTSKQSLVQRLTERPRALAEVSPQLTWSPRLQSALDRALSPEPDERYSKVNDFALEVVAAAGVPAASAQIITREMTPLSSPLVPPVPAKATAPLRRATAAASAPAPFPVSAGGSRRGLLIGGGAIVLVAVGFLVVRSMSPAAAAAPSVAGRAESTVVGQMRTDSSPSQLIGTPDTLAIAAAAGNAPNATIHRGTTKALRATPTAAVRDTTSRPHVTSIPVASPAVVSPAPPVDSISATPPGPGALTLQQRAGEIMAHANRAQQLLMNKQAPRGFVELKAAVGKYVALSADFPNAAETARVGQRLGKLVQHGLTQCRAATIDSLQGARQQVCTQLRQTAALLPAQGDGTLPQRRFPPRRARP